MKRSSPKLWKTNSPQRILPMIGAFLLVLLLSAGCNRPAGTHGAASDGPSGDQDGGAASSTADTSALVPTSSEGPLEVPYQEPNELPADFRALLEQNIAAGIWSQEQGLLTLTRYLAGALEAEAVPEIGEVTFGEATGFLGLVRSYIEQSGDTQTTAELQRLLQALSPDAETLDAYSVSAEQAASRAPGLSSRTLLVNCKSLALDGFPKDKAIACFQYQNFSFNGNTYRLYYPLDWGSQGGAQKPWVDAAFEAAQTAVKHYNAYGAQESINFVFTVLDLPKKNNFVTWADSAGAQAGNPCTIALYPVSLGKTPEAFKQIVAHEVFHCFQYTHFTVPKVVLKASDWWVEGSAEFFSNLVYPSIDLEHRWLSTFNSYSRYKPIVEMSYEAYLFFQYLNNRPDHDIPAILSLISLLPTSGGAAEQIAALSGYTNIDQIWHAFGQAFVNGEVVDSNKKQIKTEIQYNETYLFKASQPLDLDVKDFSLSRYLLSLGPGKGFHIALAKTDAEVLQVIGTLPTPTQWLPVAVDRETGCANYVALFTATGTILANPRQVKLEITVDQPATAQTTCDTCLIGVWDIDTPSFAEYLAAPFKNTDPGFFSIDSMGGVWRLEFTQQSVVTGEYNYFVAYELDQTGGGSGFGVLAQVLLDITGDGSAEYANDNVDHLIFSLLDDNVSMTQKILINGQEVPGDGDLLSGMGPSLSNGLTGAAQYTCDEKAGELYLSYDLGGGQLAKPIKYNRH
jgi:hypothetical protein